MIIEQRSNNKKIQIIQNYFKGESKEENYKNKKTIYICLQ